MPEIYKLTIKPVSGMLTELQSDTIFGHFCWRMRDLLGEDKLVEFLEFFRNNAPVFTISSAFPETESGDMYFPLPLCYSEDEDTNGLKKQDKIAKFIEHKEKKSINFVHQDILNDFLAGNMNDMKLKLSSDDEHKKLANSTELRVSVQIDRTTMAAAKNKLYSYNPKYFVNHILFILVKILDRKIFDEFKCGAVLKDIFETGYGKKKSSGYGQFVVVDYKLFNAYTGPEEGRGFISLSNFLPAANEKYDDYYYEPFVKYGKLGEEKATGGKPFKQPVTFLKPGSCFITGQVKDFYGRVTKPGEIYPADEKIIQNGYAFTLRFK